MKIEQLDEYILLNGQNGGKYSKKHFFIVESETSVGDVVGILYLIYQKETMKLITLLDLDHPYEVAIDYSKFKYIDEMEHDREDIIEDTFFDKIVNSYIESETGKDKEIVTVDDKGSLTETMEALPKEKEFIA